MLEFAGDDEAHVAGDVGAAMVFAEVFELDILEGFEAVLEVEGLAFADGALDFGPDEAEVVVHIASEFGFDIAFFAGELGFVEAGLANGDALEIKNAFPFKISTFRLVTDGEIRGPGVVIGAVFGEFGLVGLFGFEFGVGAKGEMFGEMGDFIDFGGFGVAHAGAKLNQDVDNTGAGDVNQEAFGAVF